MTSAPSREGSQVKSIVRAMNVIEALSTHPRGVKITALAAELSLPKSSVFRVLRTLLDFGYVRQDPVTERYALGTRFLHLAASVENHLDVRSLAHPRLVQLSEQTTETAHLALPVGERMVYIDKVDSPHAVTMASKVGQLVQLHCSALGKAYLSAIKPEERAMIVDRLELVIRTERTLSDATVLMNDLEICASRGYAIDDMENELGVRCAGAAVTDGRGNVVAALSVSAPASRLSLAAAHAVGAMCADTATQISADLGARLT